jgi:YidC/Oxa1 family membrane protein insertase
MVRMQHNMGQLAPRIEEIKKKFANDKAKLQQETMQVYRDQGINPAAQLLTCLPMVIQMPIWVALFLSLSNNIHMRHEAAFWGLTWIRDLTAPDALIAFSTPFQFPVVGWQITSFNLLPIFVAVFMYLQQKLQPKPAPNPNMTDQQRQQQEMMQKMMPMMSIMMLVLFFNAPSGLNLYIMFSSLFGTIEQHRIRGHIKEREAAGTLHKQRAGDGLPPPNKADRATKSGARGKVQGWLEQLQKMAEDARKAQPKRSPDRRARR